MAEKNIRMQTKVVIKTIKKKEGRKISEFSAGEDDYYWLRMIVEVSEIKEEGEDDNKMESWKG